MGAVHITLQLPITIAIQDQNQAIIFNSQSSYYLWYWFSGGKANQILLILHRSQSQTIPAYIATLSLEKSQKTA